MLECILKPIHVAQKASESEHYHVGKVIKQWTSIRNQWAEIARNDPTLEGLVQDLCAKSVTR